ncbi:MAG: hypothetical protein DRH57_01625 [Candidatus Cloacimonadota bacterium]|nr:MAG: hypothetical protein DRH57_01625 [Candidatus Cloacimonadota bacterium]
MKRILFLIILLMIISCANTVSSSNNNIINLPNWINEPSKKYPSEMYITAVGTGDTKSHAENNAYANISKIFQSDVKVKEEIIEQYKETGIGKDSELSSSVDLISNYSIGSSQSLKNVKIAETYFNAKDGLYYVLAYLDRMETALIYKKEIVKNNQIIQKYYQQYKDSPDKLDKLYFLQYAVDFGEINDILNTQLSVIEPSNEEIVSPISLEKLRIEYKALTKSIKVAITVSGEYTEEIESYLMVIMSRFGFSVVEDSEADLVFRTALKIEDVPLERRENFVRWNLTIVVKNNLSGSDDLTFTKSGREGHINKSEARNRALRTVNKVIQKDFYTYLRTNIIRENQ